MFHWIQFSVTLHLITYVYNSPPFHTQSPSSPILSPIFARPTVCTVHTVVWTLLANLWMNLLFVTSRPWKYECNHHLFRGRYSSVGIATRNGMDGPGIESLWVGGEIFCTLPDRPWELSSLLYNAYRVFPGGKAARTWRWPPTPSSAEVEGRVLPLWAFVACYMMTFIFTFNHHLFCYEFQNKFGCSIVTVMAAYKNL